MAIKHGYSSAEEFKEGAQKKFSLLENGLLGKPSARLLLVNVRNLRFFLRCIVIPANLLDRERLMVLCRLKIR